MSVIQSMISVRQPDISNTPPQPVTIRHDWSLADVEGLFNQSVIDIVYQAQTVHRQFFDPNTIQLSTLLNIKSGGCPEDCAYCPQSARHNTQVESSTLLDVEAITAAATRARNHGATRFCMGAAWRELRDKDLPRLKEAITIVKALDLETCMTLGMLTEEQANQLAEGGLDFYNHNLDTSEAYYEKIITTRTYDDRLRTLENVRNAGIKVCCGGIIGMGEDLIDRCNLLITLANMSDHPESVPINMLVKVAGTPLQDIESIDPFELIKTIAVARILMPASYVRLSAGRAALSDEQQALCFMAGANSIFYGDKLLTTDNPQFNKDQSMFRRLGIVSEQSKP